MGVIQRLNAKLQSGKDAKKKIRSFFFFAPLLLCAFAFSLSEDH